MISLDDLVEFLNQLLNVEQFENDLKGIYHPSKRSVRRLGLALEPTPDVLQWVSDRQLDALFLHRPWTLELTSFPEEIGIVAYHLSFDEQLTLGYNPWLAIALNLSNVEALGYKNERPIGMIGDIVPLSFEGMLAQVNCIFRGHTLAQSNAQSNARSNNTVINRVAVVGAMNEPLIYEASDRGADVYITGQFRKPAALAVQQTNLGIIAVGHQRIEEWGLQTLAKLIQERWKNLEVITHLKTPSRNFH
jgi:putative NIF3 family GTP cyclohydrolase 1 type 2